MRVAEAGPWWDETPDSDRADNDVEDLRAMEAVLLEAGGARIQLQLQARRALQAAGLPITRDAVTRGAYQLLINRGESDDTTGAA